jgi:quinol monooxygenase YgiN
MARVMYMVTIEVAPDVEDRWNSWHSEQHVPELLAQPGFLGARKYRDPDEGKDGWARYIVLYELESPEALEAYLAGAEVGRLRQDYAERFGPVTRLFRQIAIETETFAPAARGQTQLA